MNKEKRLPEFIVTNVTSKSWGGGAWTIAFVFSNKGNFVLRGWLADIKAELEKKRKEGLHYFVKFVLYHTKSLTSIDIAYGDCGFRTMWKFCNSKIYITEPNLKQRPNKKYYEVKNWNFTSPNRISLKFKRMPKKWIPEFEELVKFE